MFWEPKEYSHYFTLKMLGTKRVATLLYHKYILGPQWVRKFLFPNVGFQLNTQFIVTYLVSGIPMSTHFIVP